MTTTTRAPLTPTSIGVAEFTDGRQRYGLIHRATNERDLTRRNSHPHDIDCGPALSAGRVVRFDAQDSTADDWCRECWDINANRCQVTIKPGPFCAYSTTARRGTPVCSDHGVLTRGHVDLSTARDVRDEHLRAGGAG